jgi:hypothetical protein
VPSANLTLEQISVVHLYRDANVGKLPKELACFVDGVRFGSGTFQEVRVDIFQPAPRAPSHQAARRLACKNLIHVSLRGRRQAPRLSPNLKCGVSRREEFICHASQAKFLASVHRSGNRRSFLASLV